MSGFQAPEAALIVSPKIDATVSAELQYAVSTERIVLEQRGFRCRDVRRKDFPRPSGLVLGLVVEYVSGDYNLAHRQRVAVRTPT